MVTTSSSFYSLQSWCGSFPFTCSDDLDFINHAKPRKTHLPRPAMEESILRIICLLKCPLKSTLSVAPFNIPENHQHVFLRVCGYLTKSSESAFGFEIMERCIPDRFDSRISVSYDLAFME
ncbi:hypothetical protein OIU85_026157 [Salix viminalis]|uniref:Uncharacterized protein n=1 Tax=Salix viminalis TaxID=40686 RepID=A0A9Q0TN12_SALVM|nr:hypothetical protein OIU85_026157 [Salix viminalis]